MKNNKLDCCIVRDLLPSYIEELTEPETNEQVAAHLDACADCKAIEQNMRTQVPMKPIPKKSLRFLKKVQRTRLLAAVLAIILTVLCVLWLYSSVYYYPNTEAGRLAAAEDCIPGDLSHVEENTSLHIISYQTKEEYLYLFFSADNSENVHGIIRLLRGMNGKYRLVDASCGPFPYTAGIWNDVFDGNSIDSENPTNLLAGENCREIYFVQITYHYMTKDDTQREYPAVYTYPIEETNFLWIMEQKELQSMLSLEDKDLLYLHFHDMRLLNRAGEDVTEQYCDDSIDSTWSTSIGASVHDLHFFIALAVIFGTVIVIFCLRQRN